MTDTAIPTVRIEDVDTDTLRAWADAGVITTSRYVELMAGRKPDQAVTSDATAADGSAA